MTRAQWIDLPSDLRDRIEGIAGARFVSATTQTGGFSTGVAARVAFEGGVRLFVKAVPAASDGTHGLYAREADILRTLPGGLPAAHLVDAFTQGGWFVLVIEDVDGRHPESSADSADTVHVLDAIADLASIAADPSLPSLSDELQEDAGSWHRLETDGLLEGTTPWCIANVATLQRLASSVGGATAGDRLVHADLRADNILIDASGRARLLDWPWAARGAGWEDALLYLLDLLVTDPAAPVDGLLEHPVFSASSARQQDALLAAVAGSWFEKCRLPAPAGMTTLRAFQRREALTAVAWLERRNG